MRFSRQFRLPLLAVALTIGVVAVAGCGGDDSAGEHAGHDEQAQGEGRERAFLSAMVPHHRSAIAMAEIAQQRAQDPKIKRLAETIVSAQRSEIAQMERMHERLFGTALRPDETAPGQLGVSADEAGMGDSDAEIRELRSADPFDPAFVEMMVTHHEGAVRMARAVLRGAEDSELRTLAEAIISDQEREIREMNAFRQGTSGAPAPAVDGHGGGHGGDG